MRYRKDIQILRGISVLMVVLFHLEVTGMGSGFLGVDIFFVISGFLMAVLYDPSVKFKDFLFRRARRLLPAYFVTILVTIFAAFFITLPNEFNSVVTQSIFGTFLASNIGFWLDNSYFAKGAFHPLLHLWSLGVEIQFYLLVPFLFKIFSKRKIVFPICFLLSLAACFYVVSVSPKTAFFMTPLRLWEFFIGYGIATYLTENGSVKNTKFSWLGGAGLVAILAIPLMDVDGLDRGFVNGHPGLHALFVCSITGLVLTFGIPALIEKSPIGTALEIAGKYSYSVYLVHFPLIVLFLYQPFSGTTIKPNGWIQTLILLTLMLALSLAMYHFVENPIRSEKNHRIWLALASLVLLCSFAGSSLQQLRFSDKEMLIFNAWEDRSTYRCGKIFRIKEPTSISCELTTNITNPDRKIMLVGNSHADAIKTSFSSVAQDANISVQFMVGNEPLMPKGLKPKAILREAQEKKIDAILMHYNPGGIKLPAIKKLVELADNNNIQTAFIMPVPTWGLHIPQALWKNFESGDTLPQQSLQDYRKAHRDLALELASWKFDRFKVYEVAPLLCQENCSISSDSGKPLYFDGGHLTLTGSDKLKSLFKTIINDVSSSTAGKT